MVRKQEGKAERRCKGCKKERPLNKRTWDDATGKGRVGVGGEADGIRVQRITENLVVPNALRRDGKVTIAPNYERRKRVLGVELHSLKASESDVKQSEEPR